MRHGLTRSESKDHDIELNDPRLARLVKKSRDLPGEELFQYLDDAGAPHPIDSALVNAYIREIAGESYTAKDFRTWAGTLLAARALEREAAESGGEPLSKAAIARAVKDVARDLGNTPTVCRKCYIHPVVLDVFNDVNALVEWSHSRTRRRKLAGLSGEEAALLHFLEQQKG